MQAEYNFKQIDATKGQVSLTKYREGYLQIERYAITYYVNYLTDKQVFSHQVTQFVSLTEAEEFVNHATK